MQLQGTQYNYDCCSKITHPCLEQVMPRQDKKFGNKDGVIQNNTGYHPIILIGIII